MSRRASILPYVAHRELCSADPGWRRRRWFCLGDTARKQDVIRITCKCKLPNLDGLFVVRLIARAWQWEENAGVERIYIWTGVCPSCGLGYFIHSVNAYVTLRTYDSP